MVDALAHRLKHMNPRAPHSRVHFGEVPIASVFDLRGFNLNAKLEIDPEFLTEDNHEATITMTTIMNMVNIATTRTTTPTTTTSSPSPSAPTSPSARPSWKTSWAPSSRSTGRRCCATRVFFI